MILSPHEIAFVTMLNWTTSADRRIAVAVAIAESSGDTNAIARSKTGDNTGQRDHGLWQISGRWHGDKFTRFPNWRDPFVNGNLAYAVWSEKKSFSPWSVFGSGSYEQYLPDADFGLKYPIAPPVPEYISLLSLASTIGVLRDELRDEFEDTQASIVRIAQHFTD